MTTSIESALRLTGRELVDLVTGVAADVRRWSRLVQFDENERFALKLDENDERDLWLLTWLPGQHTGWHDHGGSVGAFTVVRGALREERFVSGYGRREIRLGPGASRIVPDPTRHDVGNRGGASAISIHSYSPPLRTMTYFDDDLRVQQVAEVRVPGARIP
jgi:quercetin dioxygenase-like cupin family protein